MERYINCLIYGQYGCGKSTLMGTADDHPLMRDVLFLDVESGDLALENREALDVVRVATYKTLARCYEFLRQHIKARDEGDEAMLLRLDGLVRPSGEEPKLRRYQTVVLDSLSEVAKLCMYQLLGVNIGTWKLDVEPDRPEFAEWNKATEMIRLLVRALRDLPINVLLVCSEKSDEKNLKCPIGINLSKALAAEVPGFLDMVGYLEPYQGQQGFSNRLHVEPGKGFVAKNRFPNLKQGVIDRPTMGKIYDLIQRPAPRPPGKLGGIAHDSLPQNAPGPEEEAAPEPEPEPDPEVEPVQLGEEQVVKLGDN
jgi:hypothetical protein